jgi:hypothetical protein
VNCPSIEVSQDGQCNRETVNSEWQTGQRVGAAYIKSLQTTLTYKAYNIAKYKGALKFLNMIIAYMKHYKQNFHFVKKYINIINHCFHNFKLFRRKDKEK